MKIGIFILSHMSEKEIDYHYDWHKQIGYDTKVIWQTDKQSKNGDFITVDVPGKMVVSVKMRMYCHYAKKFDYDYNVFLDCDAFILHKDFISRNIKKMQENDAEVCFSNLADYKEHYKYTYYDWICKTYETRIFSHSLNIVNICTKKAVLDYDEGNDYKSYDEVDFPVYVMKNMKYIVCEDIDYHLFNAGVIDSAKMGQISKKNSIIHALKDYELMKIHNIILK